MCEHVLSHFTRVRLCGLMDYNPQDSSVHRIIQARILEWVAMPSSMGSPDPGIEPESPASPASQVDSLPLSHWGSLFIGYTTKQKKKLKKLIIKNVLPPHIHMAHPFTSFFSCSNVILLEMSTLITL